MYSVYLSKSFSENIPQLDIPVLSATAQHMAQFLGTNLESTQMLLMESTAALHLQALITASD